MIHWTWLILAFIVGVVACYTYLYMVAKVYIQVMGAIEKGVEAVKFWKK